MRRLTKNYWRTGWILLINGAVIALFLTGPIREQRDQQMLDQVVRTISPHLSYAHALFLEPWALGLIAALFVGIVVELRRVALATILNTCPFALWLAVASWDRAKAAGGATPEDLSISTLFIVVLAVIVVINAAFYLAAFRGIRVDAPPAL